MATNLKAMDSFRQQLEIEYITHAPSRNKDSQRLIINEHVHRQLPMHACVGIRSYNASVEDFEDDDVTCNLNPKPLNIGALIIRIGFWGPLY